MSAKTNCDDIIDTTVQQQQQEEVPKVVTDGRYRAGRILVQKGQADKAINVFAILLEEARTQYGVDHFETCPAYYEYGNALFRYSNRQKIKYEDNNNNDNNNNIDNENNADDDVDSIGTTTRKIAATTSTITIPTDSSTTTKKGSSSSISNTVDDNKQNDFKQQMREAAAAAALRRSTKSVPVDTATATTDASTAVESMNTKTNTITSSDKEEIDTHEGHHNTKILMTTTTQQDIIIKTDTLVDGGKKMGTAASSLKRSYSSNIEKSSSTTTTTVEENSTDQQEGDDDLEYNQIMDDILLSLEIMETAWAILDESQQTTNNNSNYSDNSTTNDTIIPAIRYKNWIRQQVPRVLTGIGDVLACLQRHADSADVYSRALEYRENDKNDNYKTNDEKNTIEYLTLRRLIVESNILIAEELLQCPYDTDVITTETHAVLVKASEGVVDFARGYYDKARDELQEVVLLMGQLAASSSSTIDITDAKQDICFVATMVMGVGTTLAEIDSNNLQTTTTTTTTMTGTKKQKI